MIFDTEYHADWGFTVLRPRTTALGDGGSFESEGIRRRCEELASERPGLYLMDLTAIEYVDSRGLSVLVQCLMVFSKAGSRFAAFGANPLATRLMQLTRLDSVLRVYQDLGEVRDELSAGAR
ncbi:MAG: STAS domain-containing protein [Planctomycetota bacterium]